MSKVLDQTGDLNGQNIHRLLSRCDLPDFVKDAEAHAVYGSEAMTARDYADPIQKQFPFHTKEATLVSSLFLWDNWKEVGQSRASGIAKALSKRAEYFGVKKEFTDLHDAYYKQASKDPLKDLPDSIFAIAVRMPDGSVERHCPMRNATEVKTAAQYLLKFRDVIPYEPRQKMAEAISDKAGEYGCGLGKELDDFLEKQAGFGTCAASEAKSLVQTRIMALKNIPGTSQMREELAKLAEMCSTKAAQVRERDALVKLAQIIDDVDRLYHLHTKYDDVVARPEDVLFSVTIKQAESLVSDHCVSLTGSMYKIADLSRVPLEDLRDVFGEEFAESVSSGNLLVAPEKLAEQLTALPKPDAALLDRVLEKAGVTPMGKHAMEEERPWSSRDFLRKASQSMR